MQLRIIGHYNILIRTNPNGVITYNFLGNAREPPKITGDIAFTDNSRSSERSAAMRRFIMNVNAKIDILESENL